jgi:hypothetical protein
MMTSATRIEELQAESRHHRARYDLYRAKMYGQRPTTMARLRELESASQSADARVELAKAKQGLASHNA